MTEPKPIINIDLKIGELAKPIEKLVERIFDLVGIVYHPKYVTRLAKAEAEAEEIRTISDINANNLQRKALRRIIKEEERSQINIDKIVSKSFSMLEKDAKPEEITDNWMANFFSKAKAFSDDQMQILWAKVLAGEANSSGSYSRRTLDFLSNMEKDEADMFTAICSFCWKDSNNYYATIFEGEKNSQYYRKNKVNYDVMLHLESIGLIKIHPFGQFSLATNIMNIEYFGKKLTIINEKEDSVNMGRVSLTAIGRELAPICGLGEVNGFYFYSVLQWYENSYTLISPLN